MFPEGLGISTSSPVSICGSGELYGWDLLGYLHVLYYRRHAFLHRTLPINILKLLA